jgi:hypothetical protein
VFRTHPTGAHEFSSKSLADTYNANPPSSSQQKLPNSKPVRFSISSLKDSEKQQLRKMLYKQIQNYSVAPHKLTYASMTASKHVKKELKYLGYVDVPRPNPNDFMLTKEEKLRLICQHEIRKHYLSAIFKASEDATKFREYTMKTKINPKNNSTQCF